MSEAKTDKISEDRPALHPNLLFFPLKVQAIVESWNLEKLDGILLKKDLETPDWTLEQLWQAAAYHHLNLKYEEAMKYYQRLLEWTRKDDQAQGEVLASVGHIFLFSRFYKDARRTLILAGRLAPEAARSHYYLGECYLREEQEAQALNALQTFLKYYSRRDLLAARAGRIVVELLDKMGQPEKAQQTLQELSKRLDSWGFALQAQTYLPLLPESPAPSPEETSSKTKPQALPQMQFYAEEFAEWYPYRHLKSQSEPESILGPLQSSGRQLQTQVGPYLEGLAPPEESQNRGQARIALVGNLAAPELEPYHEALIELARTRSVTVISTGRLPGVMQLEEWMRFYPCNDHLDALFHAVSSHQPDLLIYLTLGPQYPNALALASQRLAPIQVALGSHPVSTGLNSLDYFLSLDWLEAEAAETQYCEKLVRLQGSPLKRVALPDQFIARQAFNINPAEDLYLCPVPASELHLQMQDLFAAILKANPRGRILLLSSTATADQLYLERFHHKHPDLTGRLQFLRSVGEVALLSLAREVPLILDPVYLGLRQEAWKYICLGTPVLTWASEQAPGRYVASLYRQLGFEDSIAENFEDYVAKAAALPRNPDLRPQIRHQLQEQSDNIFNYSDFIQSLSQFVDQQLAASGTSLPTAGQT